MGQIDKLLADELRYSNKLKQRRVVNSLVAVSREVFVKGGPEVFVLRLDSIKSGLKKLHISPGALTAV